MNPMKTVAKWAIYLTCCFGLGAAIGYATTWLADVLGIH